MRHLSEGVVRRMMDEPFAFDRRDREHLSGCPSCRARLARARADHDVVSAALNMTPVATDPRSALQNLGAHRARRFSMGISLSGFGLPRLWPVLTSVAIIGLVGFSVVNGAAGAVFQVFQPSRVTPIFVTGGELSALPDLRHFGTLQQPRNVQTHSYASLAAAENASGLHVAVPMSLPSGIPARRVFQVLSGDSSAFRFSAAKAAAYARRSKRGIPAMPQAIDGSRLAVTTRAVVLAMYGGRQEIPALVIGQSRLPTVTVEGTTLHQVESYLLGIPGVPRQLADQLKTISSPATTLPIPIPLNWAYAKHVTVSGHPGLLVGDNTGVASVVVWASHGVVYGVGGALTQDQVLEIAGLLR